MSSQPIMPLRERIQTVRSLLERSKPQIATALPRSISPDRMLRVVMTSIQKTPKLLECTETSLLGAVMQSCQLGLEPDGLIGHAYLVPYKNVCQLIIGYRGLLKLVRNSGLISTIQAHEVYERDEFSFSYGIEPTLRHVPVDSEEPGEIKAFYAVCRLKDGGEQFEVMWKRQVDAIRMRSRAADSGPWSNDYPEMGKKTVLRRLCKMLPMSIELAQAVALDERADVGIAPGFDIEVAAVDPAKEPADQQPASKLDAIVANGRQARAAQEPANNQNGAPETGPRQKD